MAKREATQMTHGTAIAESNPSTLNTTMEPAEENNNNRTTTPEILKANGPSIPSHNASFDRHFFTD